MYKVLLPILVSILVLTLCLYIFQVKLIFHPEKLNLKHYFRFSHPFNEHFIKVPGATLHALSFEQIETKPKGLVIYFHGNAGSLESWGDVHAYFAPAQYDSFVIDYRGYGKSTGSISSELQLLDDAERIYRYIQYIFGDRYQDHIILYGRSIGTGVASWLATKIKPKMLILETPYIDLPSLIQEIYPIIPKWFVRFKLDNQAHLHNVNCPIHIFHGTQDQLIPYQHGHYLSSISSDIRLHTITEGNHNNLPSFPEYHRRLRHILK